METKSLVCATTVKHVTVPQSRVARCFTIQKYQNGKNIPNDRKLYQMAIKYKKWSQNIPKFSIRWPSKIYPNLDFWFESKPSGNPVPEQGSML
jgi:cytochrome c